MKICLLLFIFLTIFIIMIKDILIKYQIFNFCYICILILFNMIQYIIFFIIFYFLPILLYNVLFYYFSNFTYFVVMFILIRYISFLPHSL